MEAQLPAPASSPQRQHVTSNPAYTCAYCPEDLTQSATLFDAAWKLIEGRFVSGPARDSARLRLATLVLALGGQRFIDAASIEAVALAALNRTPN